MQARPYEEADAAEWDRFCAAAHSATFLHTRRFLSYHGSRFVDLSLIVEDGGDWVGILPAARHPQDETCVVSHPGITYGGLLQEGALRGERMLAALQVALRHYASCGSRRLVYKTVPHIYQRTPAQDDLYALFRLNAARSRCDLSCAIDLAHRLATSERRKRSRKKAERAGTRIAEGPKQMPALWEVLKANLAREHQAVPVHSLEEIGLLVERFPENIRVVAAELDGKIEAGVVIFVTETTHHAQYIASSERGYEACALDAVFEHCISAARDAGARWFDFGTSNEDRGLVLNDGLYRFKSEFGGGGIAYEFYDLVIS
jgi:CelD/BcsL family acetyltransferase involved in cellulose biosynthesis